MNNRGIKILVWVIVLLVLCNIGLLLTIWLKPGKQSGPPQGETPRDFVIRSLKFSDDQVKKYDVLVQQHQQDMHKLRHEAMDYRQLLFANLKNGNAGDHIADSLAQLVAGNQKAIEMVTYNHFAKVRELCTDAQKQEFDKIIGDITKMMSSGPGGHHPPPPSPPPTDGPPPSGDRPGPPPPPPDGQ